MNKTLEEKQEAAKMVISYLEKEDFSNDEAKAVAQMVHKYFQWEKKS